MADNRSAAVSKGLYRWREPKWRPAFPAHARPQKRKPWNAARSPKKGMEPEHRRDVLPLTTNRSGNGCANASLTFVFTEAEVTCVRCSS